MLTHYCIFTHKVMVWIDRYSLDLCMVFPLFTDFHHLYTKLVLIKLSNLVFADAITSTVVYIQAAPLIFLLLSLFLPFLCRQSCL